MNSNERSPYSAPQSQLDNGSIVFEYVGFWARVGASIIDTILMLLIVLPIMYWTYGAEYFNSDKILHGPMDAIFNYLFPAIAVCMFWVYRSATPGKMVIGAIVVDANTGEKPSTGQFIGRYLGYYISLLVAFLGFFWVGWDRRKQGWHDKMAGTVVVKGSNPASS